MQHRQTILLLALITAGCASVPDAGGSSAAATEIVCPEGATAGAYITVIDGDGTPLPEAAITMRHPGGDLSMHLTTSAVGTASAKCLTPARGYEIEVAKEGFKLMKMPANFFAGKTIPVDVTMIPAR